MIGECLHAISTSYGLPTSLFLAGLVGSATHCTTMCSPFVLAQCGNHLELRKPARALLLPYHFGRMTTYVALGAIFHSVVNVAFVFSPSKSLIAAPLLMLAAVMFLVTAFPRISALFPWSGQIAFTVPVRFVSDKAARLMASEHPLHRYFLGVLLGFMPCGLVVAALMAASTAQNLVHASVAMSAFALGTMPALMLVGLGGQSFKQKYPRFARNFTKTALIASSLWLFALAGTMILQKG